MDESSETEPHIDWNRIARNIAGQDTPAEARAFAQWLSEDPARAELVASVRAAWEVSHDPVSQAETEMAWHRARARMVAPVPDAPVSVGRRRWQPRAIAVGAAVVCALGTGIATWHVAVRTGASQAFREFATSPKNRATVTLRDGSRLVLAPSTRLRVPVDFGVRTRTVDLDGEAYFAVVHDPARAFVVRTPRAMVRDVGTVFTVLAYGGDPDERIAVQEGEVAVGGTALRANDVASVDGAGRIVVARGADVTPYVAWTQGRLVFHDTPLGEAMREVGRTFDLSMTLADSALAGRLVTAAFGDESADKVLDVVTRVVGARYERSGRTVVVRQRGIAAGEDGTAARAPLSTAEQRP